jgi:hypothetical protein
VTSRQSASEADKLVRRYLAQLDAALRGVDASRKEEIRAEVHRHIEQGRTGLDRDDAASVRALLSRVGDPAAIALAPAANMAVCTATPSSLVCGSRATIEYVTVSPPDSGRACCPRGRQDCHQAVAASRHIGQKTCGDGTETEWRADGSGRGSMPGGPTAFSRIAAPS